MHNICKEQGQFLLDSVSLSANRNNIIGLIGNNGAGKTTFIKIIARLTSIDSGEINLPAQDKIAVVFDHSPFPGKLTINELEKVLSRLFLAWQTERFFSYIEYFDLPLDVSINNFSKGMSMKLNISVALSHQAQVLLLDEPTSGLDPVVRIEILDIIKSYVKKNEAVAVISTHILDDIEKIATSVIVMHEGKFVFKQEAEEIPDMDYLEKKIEDIMKNKEKFDDRAFSERFI